jgi:DNA polymerase-2
MKEITGWLLDVYAGKPEDGGGAWVWLLDEKDGTRRRLRQALPLAFHVAGPAPRLRAVWRYLESLPKALGPSHLSRNERCELFSDQPLTVLTVQVEHPAAQPALFRLVSRVFPDLAYYDADIPLALHHAARYNTFPLARCRLEVITSQRNGDVEESAESLVACGEGEIRCLEVLDSPWELDPAPLPLRYLTMQPDSDPSHTTPTHILLDSGRASYRLALQPVRPLLVNLRAILLRHDPDLLLTTWGDTWLLPHLLELSERYNLPLPLNRDPSFAPVHRKERTYFAYGQVIYRGRQVHLIGRWHVDCYNAVFYHDYGMEGIFELARVTSLPVQAVARLSPGSGISAMQVLTALREGILVPWHKQQAEYPKTALELLRSDQGGLVYQPVIGLHRDVAEIDFVSMYPSIMARFNISPETVMKEPPSQEGLVPKTLRPLLDKRIRLKLRLAELPSWHPRRTAYKACALAHKWLLVTCFGYLGYKNARFGRIEAHEAVTAYGREILMRAKEAAEEQGYEVLHMYVDGMWVRKPGHSRVPDFQPLLDEIAARTSLSIALDGIYRWVAFLPSRLDSRVPVPNRYFGVFQDGSLKMRGIEARRQDTPPWIVRIQVAMLDCLASYHAVSPQRGDSLPPPRMGDMGGQPDLYGNDLPECLPRLEGLLRKACSDLQRGRVPLAELLVSQKLSRELGEYTVPSPAARAATQLAAIGKHLRPGQRVRFMYTLGDPGVRAWDLPETFNPATIDRQYYRKLLLRAASSVLQPFEIELVNFTASEGYLCKTGR